MARLRHTTGLRSTNLKYGREDRSPVHSPHVRKAPVDARCEPGGSVFRAVKPASATDAPPAEDYISEHQESTGFYFHIVSVHFYASVLIFTVLAAGGWIATLP